MARVKFHVAAKKRKKRVLKASKGFRGGRGKLYRTAKETVMRAKAFSTRHRKLKKRDFRALWIARINAACKEHGLKYSQFIDGLKKAKISLDRKMLSELAVANKAEFKKLVEMVKPQK